MGLSIDQMGGGGQTGAPAAQGNSGKMPGWAYTVPVIGQALGSLGGSFGANQQAKLQQQQIDLQRQNQQWGQQMDTMNAQRQLDADAYGRANQNMTNPARIQVMNALMQRMGLGAGFQEQKQGPVGPMVVNQAQNPLQKQQDDQIKQALAAVTANYIGRSGGKQRYGSAQTGAEYTNKEREQALALLKAKGINPAQATPGLAQAWNKTNPGMPPIQPWQGQGYVPLGQG